MRGIVSIKVASAQSADELLRIAASLDQASQHIMAQTIVEEAQRKGLKLVVPGDVVETPGEGIEGLVEGRHVVVGGYRFVSERVLGIGLPLWRAERPAGAAAVAVGIDGKFAGALIFADELRAGTQALLQKLGCWASSGSCSPPAIAAMWPRWSRGACRSMPCGRSSLPTRKPWWFCPNASTARS